MNPVSWIIRLRKLVDTLCPHIIKIVCLLLYHCHLIFITTLNLCRSQNQCFDLRFLATFTNWNTIQSFCQIPQRLRYQTLGEWSRRSPHFFPPMKPTDSFDLSYLNPVDEKAHISAIASVRAAVASTTNMESLLAQLQSISTLLEFILSGEIFWISIAWLYIKTTQHHQNVPRYYQRIFYPNTQPRLTCSRPLQINLYNNFTGRYFQYRVHYQWKFPNKLMGA